jgi:polar amino acid transport system substrate-binding protein
VERHIIAARNYDDAVSLQLRFADGSIGTIVYSSLGDRSFPKEYIEVFGAGRVITIDDFRRAVFVADGRTKRPRLARQDKGFNEELGQFLSAVRGDQEPPISLHSLMATTLQTFPVLPSLPASNEDCGQ